MTNGPATRVHFACARSNFAKRTSTSFLSLFSNMGEYRHHWQAHGPGIALSHSIAIRPRRPNRQAHFLLA
jgi:hypothetical protein